MLPDAACKHQCVQAPHGRRECAVSLPDSKIHRSLLAWCLCEKIAHVGTSLGHAEQTGFMVDEMVKLHRRQMLALYHVPGHAEVQIA